MHRLIDPTVDIVFKEILGSEHHRNLIINFINAILGYDEPDRVVDVVLRNPSTSGTFLGSKLSLVDVRVLDQRGREYQIEIQVSSSQALPQRMLHNWCSVYHARIAGGQAYDQLEPVIAIWILCGDLPALPLTPTPRAGPRLKRKTVKCKTDLVHLAFEIYCSKSKLFLTDHFGIHVLQLRNWRPDDTIESDKGRWMNFFKLGKNLDPENLPGWMETPEMREAMGILRKFSEQEENYALYQSRLDQIRVQRSWEYNMEKVNSENRALKAELEQVRSEENQERKAVEEALRRSEREKAARLREKAARQREKVAREREKAAKERERAEKEREKAAKERERAEKEREKAAKEQERIQKEAALAEVQRLREQLRRAGLEPTS